MNQCPFLSVIVPVYNVEKFLPPCVDSILAQTYTNLEIILVDDGSTDISGKICDAYAQKDTRVRVIHQPNSGVCAARNAGLQAATGEYIGFVDGDDWLEPTMYAYLLALCQRFNAPVSVCEYHGCKQVNLYEQEGCFSAQAWYAHPRVLAFVVTKLFSRNLLQGVRFDPSISVGEDGLFSLQAITPATRVAYGPQQQYHYRHNPASVSHSRFRPKDVSVLRSIRLMREIARQNQWPRAIQKFNHDEIFSALWLLHKIAKSDTAYPHETKELLLFLRKHLFELLRAKEPYLLKGFGVLCCINFNWAKALLGKWDKNV